MLLDMAELSWAHAKGVNPFVAKRNMAIVQVIVPWQ